jgi:ABC-type dipeptide transport system, periplasmic component
MKRKSLYIIAVVVVMLIASLAFVACNKDKGNKDNNQNNNTLVISSDDFNGKFNPFFGTWVADVAIGNDLTQSFVMTVDRNGEYVLNGIDGTTTSYQGQDYTYYSLGKFVESRDGDNYVYTLTIRPDVKFSDGVTMTIDDVIFNLYVYSDPHYDGPASIYKLPIIGLKQYYSGNLDLSDASLDAFLANPDEAAIAGIKEVVAELIGEEYDWAGTAEGLGYSYEEGNPESFLAFYGDESWDNSDAPTTGADAIREYYVNYAVDFYWQNPRAFDVSYGGAYLVPAERMAIKQYLTSDLSTFAPNIAGLERLSDTSLKITCTEEDPAFYQNMQFGIAPLHYYGSTAAYNYANNQFGFTKGNLDAIKANNTPIGAGPYYFESYNNGVVTLKANEYYYKGVPKVKILQVKELEAADKNCRRSKRHRRRRRSDV